MSTADERAEWRALIPKFAPDDHAVWFVTCLLDELEAAEKRAALADELAVAFNEQIHWRVKFGGISAPEFTAAKDLLHKHALLSRHSALTDSGGEG